MPLILPKHSRNQRLFNWLQKPHSADKHILVMGGGASGIAAFELLTKLGLRVIGADDKGSQAHPLFQPTETILKQSLIKSDLVVLSPGIPLTHPLVARAQQLHIPIIGEVELGLTFIEESTRVIGITGTNGKSTVTHCVAALLTEHHGTPCAALGNIGSSVCNYVMTGQSAPTLAVELSSYQLETMGSASFDAAIFTNFSPDHLARYGDLETYFRAKWRLCHLLKPRAPLALSTDFAAAAIRFGGCVPADRPVFLIHQTPSNAQPAQVSIERNPRQLWDSYSGDLRLPVPGYLFKHQTPDNLLETARFETVNYICATSDHFTFTFHRAEDNEHRLLENDETLDSRSITLQQSLLRGTHNAQNLAFCRFVELAILASNPSKIPTLFSGQTSRFKTLPHRQEVIETPPSSRIRVINDSKSTSFICTSRALACFPRGTHLLLGGLIKDRDIEAIVPGGETPVCVEAVYTFGPEAAWLAERARALLGAPAMPFESMHAATRAALGAAKPGETVLLSPGAASFDSFQGFEDRGQQFTLEVKLFFAEPKLRQ